MRTKQIKNDIEYNSGFGGAGAGDTERFVYECLCGKGKIIEEHDNTPGFRDHYVTLSCDECDKKYKLDTSQGVHAWELVER